MRVCRYAGGDSAVVTAFMPVSDAATGGDTSLELASVSDALWTVTVAELSLRVEPYRRLLRLQPDIALHSFREEKRRERALLALMRHEQQLVRRPTLCVL